MRRTFKQLAFDLFMISRRITRDRYYKHQSSGGVYKVIGYAILEATGEPLVLYRPAAVNSGGAKSPCGLSERPADECVFARPATEFDEVVQWHDGEITRAGERFTQVRKVETWVAAN